MDFLLLVPGFVSLFLVLRGRIETAFLSVYLPCLLCLPDEYKLRIPHTPPTSAAQFALIPLGIVALYRLIRSCSFAFMDILVLLYTASIGLSEILHAPPLYDAFFSLASALISNYLSYLVGRKLIEPELRLATVRRFVILVLLNGPAGLFEWRMGQNPYGIFGQRFLGTYGVAGNVQLRNGHGRMAGAFVDAEIAGIIFAMTYCMNSWLVYLRRIQLFADLDQKPTMFDRLARTFRPSSLKYHVPGLLLLVYVFLTQSRGPMIALAAGYLILQIPQFKNTRIATIVVAVLLAGGYFATSAYFAAFKNVDQTSMTEQQESTLYRHAMNAVYPAIAEQGGWTGYGVVGIPHAGGMLSIDNHYLLVHLAWGRLGYSFLLLIVWGNVCALLVRSWRLELAEDRAFVFSVMAAMAVLWLTLLTVFMGLQLPQVAFLLIGWIQSTGQQRPLMSKGLFFRRIFT